MKKLGISLFFISIFAFAVECHYAIKGELLGEKAFYVLLVTLAVYWTGLIVFLKWDIKK